MSDAIQLVLIASLCSTVLSVFTMLFAFLAQREAKRSTDASKSNRLKLEEVTKTVEDVGASVNGRMTELLEVHKGLSRIEGAQEERRGLEKREEKVL